MGKWERVTVADVLEKYICTTLAKPGFEKQRAFASQILKRMKATNLEKLKKQMTEHLQKCRDNGVRLTSYECPHCESTQETIVPTEDLVTDKGYWDSLKTCYECGGMSFVKIFTTGIVEVINLEAENTQVN